MSDRPKVLAVDDSATIRKAMELVLDPAEYELELAASGSEAVAKAVEFQPAVILLDFILPDMRGADVCQKLSEDPITADIPIVLISAKGAEIRQAYDNIPAVVSYITKPFTPAGVTSVIDEAISAKEAVAEAVADEFVPAMADDVSGEKVTANGSPSAVEEDYDDLESGEWEAEEDSAATPLAMGVERDGLEAMFETLRSSLEGVFVEEGDTRAGAAADESMSHHELAARLARQVRESLSQTESGARYNLCSDGSIRSLDDSLLDAYRRFCRLLFRAARDGAVQNEVVASNRPRVMFISACEGGLGERFKSIAQEKGDQWTTAMVVSDYRQLPIMTRVFGPTHIVVEAIRGAAAWDQLEIVSKLPEGRRVRVVGVAMEGSRDGVSDREMLAERGVETVLGAGAALPQALAEVIAPSARRDPLSRPSEQGVDAAPPALAH